MNARPSFPHSPATFLPVGDAVATSQNGESRRGDSPILSTFTASDAELQAIAYREDYIARRKACERRRDMRGAGEAQKHINAASLRLVMLSASMQGAK